MSPLVTTFWVLGAFAGDACFTRRSAGINLAKALVQSAQWFVAIIVLLVMWGSLPPYVLRQT